MGRVLPRRREMKELRTFTTDGMSDLKAEMEEKEIVWSTGQSLILRGYLSGCVSVVSAS